MSADEWPVEIDGDEFYPIPESWIEHGSDQDRGSPRIYAVSVASGVRNLIVIRYASPDGRAVKVTTNGAENPSGGGTVPSALANHGDWPRSMIPSRHVEPTGLLRKAESEHFQELWADRLQEDSDAETERQLVADGGTVTSESSRTRGGTMPEDGAEYTDRPHNQWFSKRNQYTIKRAAIPSKIPSIVANETHSIANRDTSHGNRRAEKYLVLREVRSEGPGGEQ